MSVPALSAARSALALVFVTVYVLVAVPIVLAVRIVVKSPALPYALAHFAIGLALALTGVRYRIAGREHVPGCGVLFCANHRSNVDSPVLFHTLHRRLAFLYKRELRQVPLLGTVFDFGTFVAVDRGSGEKALASIRRAAEAVRAGRSFLIFPEGTRSTSGALLPFKKGGLVLAIQAQAPVIPVAVLGGSTAMPKGSGIVRSARVTVRIGRPIPTIGLTSDDRHELQVRVRAAVQDLLDQGSLWP